MANFKPLPENQFKGKGLGTIYKQAPMCAVFPEPFNEILKAMENRSEYIRKAVINQMTADGLI